MIWLILKNLSFVWLDFLLDFDLEFQMFLVWIIVIAELLVVCLIRWNFCVF